MSEIFIKEMIYGNISGIIIKTITQRGHSLQEISQNTGLSLETVKKIVYYDNEEYDINDAIKIFAYLKVWPNIIEEDNVHCIVTLWRSQQCWKDIKDCKQYEFEINGHHFIVSEEDKEIYCNDKAIEWATDLPSDVPVYSFIDKINNIIS